MRRFRQEEMHIGTLTAQFSYRLDNKPSQP
jgi:hypothetical protein